MSLCRDAQPDVPKAHRGEGGACAVYTGLSHPQGVRPGPASPAHTCARPRYPEIKGLLLDAAGPTQRIKSRGDTRKECQGTNSGQ
jgi:hypothetical protein